MDYTCHLKVYYTCRIIVEIRDLQQKMLFNKSEVIMHFYQFLVMCEIMMKSD